MAVAIGIASGIIGIVTLAPQGTKFLSDTIGTYRTAAPTLADLEQDVAAIDTTLRAINSSLQGITDDDLSDSVKKRLDESTTALKGCGKACEDFSKDLKDNMSHSKDGKVSKRDQMRFWPEEETKRLAQCLKTASFTLAEVASQSGTTVKYAQCSKDATQLLGTFGDIKGTDFAAASTTVEKMVAKDTSFQAAGHFSENAFAAALDRNKKT